ncbi:MAG: hypothetical protein ACM3H8_02875 [Sphingobacteriales bacterium]
MEKAGTNEPDKKPDELIVIQDECGDTMWDAVLEQDVKDYDSKELDKKYALLLNKISPIEESEANTAEQAD